jgi:glutathione S-transferase
MALAAGTTTGGCNMKLYSGPLSLFTAKVRVALAEKGVPYERIEVGWNRRDRYLPHHPDVVAINPKRQVPCLVDDDVTLYDSTVILEYLEDRHPDPPLMPRDPAGRARCRLLELEADEVLFPHLWTLIDTRFYPGSDPAGGEEAVAGVHGYHERLARALGQRAFLCGDFGVADIGNFIMLSVAGLLGAPVGRDTPALAAWMAAERPAVAAEMAAMSDAAATA